MLLVGGILAGCRKSSNPTDSGDEGADASRHSSSYFTEITHDVGLDFVHENGAAGSRWLAEISPSGVALFDFDNDGDLDIYFTNGHRRLGRSEIGGGCMNRLFRQEDDGNFADVSLESGLGDQRYGMGVAIGDVDNDGDSDVYLANLGHDQLYRNRGDGTFENVTRSANVDVDGWSSSAAFFDYDRDGFLDLYIARYVDWNAEKVCYSQTGGPEYCGPKAFLSVHDVLLHNNGDGTFSDVAKHAGIAGVVSAGLGVVCEDLNDDGWIDVYVANDMDANNLWINQKDGTFRDDALLLGTAYNMYGRAEAGMGVVAADFDNDGDFDLFMTHLGQETNTLYRNDGAAHGFVDVTGQCGLAVSSIPYTGFGTAAFDVDLDGYLDIFVVNGRVQEQGVLAGSLLQAPFDRLAEPNLFYVNDGIGHFTLIEEPAASICQPIEISRGLAVGDIDADGDVDLVVSNIHSASRLYRNDAPRNGAWLMVRAVDPRLNRDAIGARVTVTCGDRRFARTISRGFSYLSSSDVRAHFGLGPARGIDAIDVRWPDGLTERFGGVPLNSAIVLSRGTGEKADPKPSPTEAKP